MEFIIDGKESDDHPIGRRQTSLHSPLNYKAPNLPPVVNKKKPGLLKGIGSMFRLVKNYCNLIAIS